MRKKEKERKNRWNLSKELFVADFANNLILGLLGTTEQTSSPGSDETSLLTVGGVAGDGRGFTNMLVVTTTVRL